MIEVNINGQQTSLTRESAEALYFDLQKALCVIQQPIKIEGFTDQEALLVTGINSEYWQEPSFSTNSNQEPYPYDQTK